MQHYAEILVAMPTRERFLVVRLSRRQYRTYCIALSLLRFAPSMWRYHFLPPEAMANLVAPIWTSRSRHGAPGQAGI